MKLFKDVKIGEVFTYRGIIARKISPRRASTADINMFFSANEYVKILKEVI